MTRDAQAARMRDAALSRLRRTNRVLVAGSVGLAALLAAATATRGAASKSTSRHATHGGGNSQGKHGDAHPAPRPAGVAPLRPPEEAPRPAPEAEAAAEPERPAESERPAEAERAAEAERLAESERSEPVVSGAS